MNTQYGLKRKPLYYLFSNIYTYSLEYCNNFLKMDNYQIKFLVHNFVCSEMTNRNTLIYYNVTFYFYTTILINSIIFKETKEKHPYVNAPITRKEYRHAIHCTAED